MREVARFADQITRAFRGDAWHGPALRELLADVSAERAAARPLAEAHTIWEIVLHLAAWDGAIRRRLEGVRTDVPQEGDWPPVRETTAGAWQKTLALLDQRHEQLLAAIDRLDDSRLADLVIGKEYPVTFMLHGIPQHVLYHAGQIALLKKA